MRIKTTILLLLIAGALTAQVFEPVPFDKKYHMGAGALAGVWGTFAGNSLQLTAEQSALCGVAAATIAGIGKECMDVAPAVFGHKDARFDTMDIAATVGGGIIGAGLSYVALKIFKERPPRFYGQADKNVKVGLIIQF